MLGCFGEVSFAVLVLHVGDGHVDFVLWSEVDAVVVERDFVGDFNVADYRCFIGPASRHISKSISSTTEEKSGNIELLQELCS